MSGYHWVMIAGFLGFTGVGLGAFGAHALKKRRDAYFLDVFKTGVQYHLFHTLVILVLGIWLIHSPLAGAYSASRLAAVCLSLGIFFFSGSLYLLTLTKMKSFGGITPIGGVLFLLGWIFIIQLAWELSHPL